MTAERIRDKWSPPVGRRGMDAAAAARWISHVENRKLVIDEERAEHMR
ncbi:hypothetical protein [Jhaorihella thermophila]